MPDKDKMEAGAGLKTLRVDLDAAAEAVSPMNHFEAAAVDNDPDRRPLLGASDADLADILEAIMAMEAPMRALLERRRLAV